ncbi:MAG TPA: DegT/DnrJ/EryC1/StrS family aminotransferase [bacterium]|nr:DegT/DnrJ/EryC1/StrS family aminotransferase [bacterium]
MIPYLDLKAQYRSIQAEIGEAVARVLESGHYVLGPEVAAFEQAFAAYCGTRHCVAVNSGTSALQMALLAAGVGPGDEVITTPLTFVATAAAVLYVGARPVFVDVDPATLNLDPAKVIAAVGPRTKVILPVHLHGRPAEMGPLLDISDQSGIPVIEDAAQAHGAEYKGKRVGGLGLAGCFSFYPGKNLGAYGEGGAVTTNDEALAKKVRSLRDWGAEKRYHHDLAGFNGRMEALQGAILGVKLKYIEKWTEARRGLAKLYDEKLEGLPLAIPRNPPHLRSVHHVYAVRVEKRDALQEFLSGRGIQTNIHYPIPVHLQKAYAHLGHGLGEFPLAEKACSQLLSLPLYPEMTGAQVDEVVAGIKEGLAMGKG